MNQKFVTKLEFVVVGNPSHWVGEVPDIVKADGAAYRHFDGKPYVAPALRGGMPVVVFVMPVKSGMIDVAVLSKN